MANTGLPTKALVPFASEQPRGGLLQVLSGNQVNAKLAAENPELKKENTRVLTGLESQIDMDWSNAKRDKERIAHILMMCERMMRGEYDAAKLAAIRETEASEIYMLVGAEKANDLSSWLKDVLRPAGDKPWDIEATPEPDLPDVEMDEINQQVGQRVLMEAFAFAEETGEDIDADDVLTILEQKEDEVVEEVKNEMDKEAQRIADRMSRKIEDQLVEGGFAKAFKDFLLEFAKFPAAFIKSPVIRMKKRKKWNENGELVVVNELVKEQDWVSAWDIYPEGNSRDINDGFLFQRHKLRRKHLNRLIGVPGYKGKVIREVLAEWDRGGLREWLWTDTERAILENRDTFTEVNANSIIDALEYWGDIQGKTLIEWGMSETEIPDADIDYSIHAWVVGGRVIMAVINPDKFGRKPYHKASVRDIPGAFWGEGICQIVEHIQTMCNSTARALQNNIAIASGPMVEANADRLEGEDLTRLWPWRIFQTTGTSMGTNEPAIRTYNLSMHAAELMAIYKSFKQEADEITGIPSYAHGDPDVGGAGNTASGLSMLMTAAARGVKDVLSNIDIGVIAPIVEMLYDFNMFYDDDPKIKGDLRVKATGSSSLIAKDNLAVRRQEMLNATNNPTDIAIMGLAGRQELLKQAFMTVEIDHRLLFQGVVENRPGNPPAPEIPGEVVPGAAGGGAQELDAAGNPIVGQDTRLFNEGGG